MCRNCHICLVAELPKNFNPETEKKDPRINLFDQYTRKAVEKCTKRMAMSGVIHGQDCDGCPACCRLDLEMVGC